MLMSKSSKILHCINYPMRVTIQDGRQLIEKFMAFNRHMNLNIWGKEVISLTVEGLPTPDNSHLKTISSNAILEPGIGCSVVISCKWLPRRGGFHRGPEGRCLLRHNLGPLYSHQVGLLLHLSLDRGHRPSNNEGSTIAWAARLRMPRGPPPSQQAPRLCMPPPPPPGGQVQMFGPPRLEMPPPQNQQ
ncbi:Small nuclear ribonucleoprotein-associated protein B [Sesamum alatum]|uniref:Small nuclear ribonucleoprotein-associated protein B n=1 Tax=Sesamum alatum TaxID=300844 RepID=A0AAE2CB79_9LAMI|nr:Small nuclear ribonucleoprotein-associated protein B [Sesamum alatum]